MRHENIADKAGLWNYFYARVDAILKRHRLLAAGWEELGASRVMQQGAGQLAPNPTFKDHGFTLYVWRNIEGAEDLANQLANAGYDTVLTPATRLYFDMVHYPSPEEPGQNWAGYADLDRVFDFDPYNDIRLSVDDATPAPGKERLTEAGKQHIRGIEGTLFTETVRDPARLEYMLMPRLLALAERAWAPEPSWALATDRSQAATLHAAAWSQFVNQLGQQVLPALDAGEPAIRYRIPPPGLAIIDGAVMVNEQLPGFALRYSVDGYEPTVLSPLVAGPIRSMGAVQVSAFDHSGRHSHPSRIEIH
jgi:hexosaminidase